MLKSKSNRAKIITGNVLNGILVTLMVAFIFNGCDSLTSVAPQGDKITKEKILELAYKHGLDIESDDIAKAKNPNRQKGHINTLTKLDKVFAQIASHKGETIKKKITLRNKKGENVVASTTSLDHIKRLKSRGNESGNQSGSWSGVEENFTWQMDLNCTVTWDSNLENISVSTYASGWTVGQRYEQQATLYTNVISGLIPSIDFAVRVRLHYI